MNNWTIRWLASVFLVACSTTNAGGLYLGIKFGPMIVDDNSFDEAVNGGLVLGYDLAETDLFAVALEAEFTDTLADGHIGESGVAKWEIETQAIYGVVRVGGGAYLKLKVGYLNEDVTAKASGLSFDASDSGGSGGIGVGLRAGESVYLELEYTVIEEDVEFITGGINFRF